MQLPLIDFDLWSQSLNHFYAMQICFSIQIRLELIGKRCPFLKTKQTKKQLHVNFPWIVIQVLLFHWKQAAAHPWSKHLLTFPAISSHPVPWRGDTDFLCPLPSQCSLGERPKAVLRPSAADTYFLPRMRKTGFKVISGTHTDPRAAWEHTWTPEHVSRKLSAFMLKPEMLEFWLDETSVDKNSDSGCFENLCSQQVELRIKIQDFYRHTIVLVESTKSPTIKLETCMYVCNGSFNG